MPTFKLFLATNHEPSIRGPGHSIGRPIRLVLFNVTIPEAEQDRELGTKLLAELDGILALAVWGCLEWQRIGLKPPAAVVRATPAYRADSDVIGGLLENCCISDGRAMVLGAELHDGCRA